MIADALEGLLAALNADADVAALTSGRVYAMSLPRDEAGAQPRKALVIQPSGGAVAASTGGTAPVQSMRVDIRCHGETLFEAERVRRAAHQVLRRLSRQVAANVLLHSANPAGGPTVLRDPDADWPIINAPWQLLADERAA